MFMSIGHAAWSPVLAEGFLNQEGMFPIIGPALPDGAGKPYPTKSLVKGDTVTRRYGLKLTLP
jgi:hypothetical protein